MFIQLAESIEEERALSRRLKEGGESVLEQVEKLFSLRNKDHDSLVELKNMIGQIIDKEELTTQQKAAGAFDSNTWLMRAQAQLVESLLNQKQEFELHMREALNLKSLFSRMYLEQKKSAIVSTSSQTDKSLLRVPIVVRSSPSMSSERRGEEVQSEKDCSKDIGSTHCIIASERTTGTLTSVIRDSIRREAVTPKSKLSEKLTIKSTPSSNSTGNIIEFSQGKELKSPKSFHSSSPLTAAGPNTKEFSVLYQSQKSVAHSQPTTRDLLSAIFSKLATSQVKQTSRKPSNKLAQTHLVCRSNGAQALGEPKLEASNTQPCPSGLPQKILNSSKCLAPTTQTKERPNSSSLTQSDAITGLRVHQAPKSEVENNYEVEERSQTARVTRQEQLSQLVTRGKTPKTAAHCSNVFSFAMRRNDSSSQKDKEQESCHTAIETSTNPLEQPARTSRSYKTLHKMLFGQSAEKTDRQKDTETSLSRHHTEDPNPNTSLTQDPVLLRDITNHHETTNGCYRSNIRENIAQTLLNKSKKGVGAKLLNIFTNIPATPSHQAAHTLLLDSSARSKSKTKIKTTPTLSLNDISILNSSKESAITPSATTTTRHMSSHRASNNQKVAKSSRQTLDFSKIFRKQPAYHATMERQLSPSFQRFIQSKREMFRSPDIVRYHDKFDISSPHYPAAGSFESKTAKTTSIR